MKIQALFDKAASTEFEAEPETFYAKAQELMIQHAIDEQMLADAKAGRDAFAKPILKVVPFSQNDAYIPGRFSGSHLEGAKATRLCHSYVRFCAELPNERWQADTAHWALADGATSRY